MVLRLFSRALYPLPALLLAGCATTGDPGRRPGRTPVDVAGASAADAPQQRAEDDRALTGAVLDRRAYVRAVLHRNPSIEAARQGWRAAIARVRQSAVFDDPMVSVQVAPLSIGSSTARFGYDAMVSQRLPWPGKRALEESAAKADADAARSDFEAARRELALSAALLYDEYFVEARSLEIHGAHVVLMRSMHAAATAEYESGRASAQDPLQAEFELTHMEHDAVILASQRDVTVAQMNELLHRAPELPLPPPPREIALAPVPDRAQAARLEEEAVAHRPDIRAARQKGGASQARAERAERDALPDVTVSTSYNSMWDMPEHRWMVGLSFDLPLQSGRRGGAAEEARAMRAQYEAQAARTSDMARTQVVVSLDQLEESSHVLHLYEERLVPLARDRVQSARAAFVASQAPFMSVMDAERTLRQVELEQQTARADYDRHRGELDRALGRMPGLDGEEDAP